MGVRKFVRYAPSMRILYSIILSQIFLSCNFNKTDNSTRFKFLSDTTNNYGQEYKHHQKLTDALLLSRIDSGVDSIELRIWNKSAIINLHQLTILNYKDSGWHLTRTTYWSNTVWNLDNSKITIDSSETKQLDSKIPYTAVADTIAKYRLDTIPTQTQIPNFEDRTADGTTYVIELATNKYYKSLSYSNPKFYTELNHQKNKCLFEFLF